MPGVLSNECKFGISMDPDFRTNSLIHRHFANLVLGLEYAFDVRAMALTALDQYSLRNSQKGASCPCL
jgi:hypothetical protein